MAANFLHGVETIEIEKGPRPILSCAAGPQTCVCTHPAILTIQAAPLCPERCRTLGWKTSPLHAVSSNDKFETTLTGD